MFPDCKLVHDAAFDAPARLNQAAWGVEYVHISPDHFSALCFVVCHTEVTLCVFPFYSIKTGCVQPWLSAKVIVFITNWTRLHTA